MDFFQEQDRARRSSNWLVLLFLLAVVGIIAGVYLIIVLLFGYANSGQATQPTQWWNPELLLWTTGGVGLLIGSGSLFKVMALSRGGGTSVAESLGGTLVSRETNDRLERRLLNVVDEMAIASGVPVPQVYILADEPNINAFAAGTTPNDAVVAVTRGCLEQLTRDELQGVVAHEFSHIFNGDMRLNLRLIGLLHGILLLALLGRMILRGSGRSRSKNSGGGMALGLGLVVVGYLGVFFGRLIKAAVSRQREYLADASAVQFTRQTDGIGGALKKIGGYGAQVAHPNAEEASHLFFGQGLSYAFGSLFATHPPIEERIAKLDPAFAALQASAQTGGPAAEGAALGFAAGAPTAVSAGALLGSVGNPNAQHADYAKRVIGQLSEPVYADLNRREGVASVVYGLLVASAEDPAAMLRSVLDDTAVVERAAQHARWFRQANRAVWLPVVELALPALQELEDAAQYRVLKDVDALVRADGRLSIFEFALTAVIEHSLKERWPKHAARSVDVLEIRQAITVMLSLLVHAGHSDPAQAQAAFEAATNVAPLDGPWQLQGRGEIAIKALESALERLGRLNFRFKRRLIEACLAAVTADGKVTINEAELLRAIGARLDAPVPPLFPGALADTEGESTAAKLENAG